MLASWSSLLLLATDKKQEKACNKCNKKKKSEKQGRGWTAVLGQGKEATGQRSEWGEQSMQDFIRTQSKVKRVFELFQGMLQDDQGET